MRVCELSLHFSVIYKTHTYTRSLCNKISTSAHTHTHTALSARANYYCSSHSNSSRSSFLSLSSVCFFLLISHYFSFLFSLLLNINSFVLKVVKVAIDGIAIANTPFIISYIFYHFFFKSHLCTLCLTISMIL